MTNEEKRSIEAARVLGLAASRTVGMNIDQIVPVLDEAEATCLEREPSEELRLELKRRVAEWKMMLHCDRDAAFETVEALRNDVIDLGYTNLEREANLDVYFALYCERQGKLNEARQILQRMMVKLESSLDKEGLKGYRYFEEYVEAMLSRIDARRSQ